ncbi:MAG: hypothetical protein IT334_10945 [Thermomicrobiales bacterium]|nr:hypothetical protein [Thermomicrobiales bacterium]
MTDPAFRLDITPEPTDEEAAAVAAALLILSAARQVPPEAEAGHSIPRWKLAGRIGAHNGSPASNRNWSDATAWLKR